MVDSLTPVVDIYILIVTLGLFFVAALMEIGVVFGMAMD